MCCCQISARSNHGIKESLYHFCFSLHVLCTCLPADQGAHAAGSQLPAERLTPHSARTLRRAGHFEHCCPRASRLNALPGCWAPASCLPLPELTLKLVETHHVSLLPPKVKFSHSWRTASLWIYQERPFYFTICISTPTAHFRFPCSSLLCCLLSSLAERRQFLPRSVQPLVSLSLGPGICFHLLSAVCTSRQSRLLVFASVTFWEAPSLRADYRKHLEPHLSAAWTGGLFSSVNHIVINFSPCSCSAAPSPLRHPSPCSLLQPSAALSHAVAATILPLVCGSSPSSPGCHYLLDPWMCWQNVWLGVHT